MPELKTMTVGELRAQLARFPDDAPVVLLQPSHDHWGSELGTPVERVGSGTLEYSAYHRQFKVRKS